MERKESNQTNKSNRREEKEKTVFTVKPVLIGHSEIYKTKVLMENCSLMKVESIAEWEHPAMFLTCIKRYEG